MTRDSCTRFRIAIFIRPRARPSAISRRRIVSCSSLRRFSATNFSQRGTRAFIFIAVDGRSSLTRWHYDDMTMGEIFAARPGILIYGTQSIRSSANFNMSSLRFCGTTEIFGTLRPAAPYASQKFIARYTNGGHGASASFQGLAALPIFLHAFVDGQRRERHGEG